MNSLRNAIEDILRDMEDETGAFDDSMMRYEKRELASDLIVKAIADADYGPRPSAG